MKNSVRLLCVFLLFVTCKVQATYILKEEYISPDCKDFDCHSSTIVETTKGRFCAVWKGGPGHGRSNIEIKENVGLWQTLFDGTKWSAPQEIFNANRSVAWNPVLCRNEKGELLLFTRVGPDPRNTVSLFMRSLDGGSTWSEPQILPAGICGPTKNKPLMISEGQLLCPSSSEVGSPDETLKATACWVELFKNDSWERYGPFELKGKKFGVIEPAFFRDCVGNLKMVTRDRARKIGGTGSIWIATSTDLGRHWSSFQNTYLPNPDSAFDVVDLGEGRAILIYNHNHREREPLNLAITTDGGNTWSQPLVFSEKGEFPAGILASDGTVHITYAIPTKDGQRRIKHIVLDPKKL